jgi:hypothetical protein
MLRVQRCCAGHWRLTLTGYMPLHFSSSNKVMTWPDLMPYWFLTRLCPTACYSRAPCWSLTAQAMFQTGPHTGGWSKEPAGSLSSHTPQTPGPPVNAQSQRYNTGSDQRHVSHSAVVCHMLECGYCIHGQVQLKWDGQDACCSGGPALGCC